MTDKTPQDPTGDNGFSRRNFLRGMVLGTTAAVLPLVGAEPARASETNYPATAHPAPTFDFTRQSGALQPDRVVDSACQFCNCNCRLKVSVKDNRIIDVGGEVHDPVQAGGLCVKGPMMTQLVYNQHRLTQPLKRVSGTKGEDSSTFAPISWEEALDTMARRMIALRDAGEPWAVVNKTSGRLPRGTGSLVHRVFELYGSPNDTDVGPVCNDAGGDALGATFGMGNFTNGYGVDPSTGKEDLGAARVLLFFGTNQAETQPVTFAYLLRCREKTKAKLIVVDPRRTPTAAQADEWLAPKPHTDLALALGMLYHIVDQKLYDAPFVERWVLGFAELKAHLLAGKYTPDWAAGVCDVPADKIRSIAHLYATQRPSAIFCNAGISHQLSAFDTYRALAFLAAITGNIGVPGGGCNFMHNTWPGGLNLPSVKGSVPPRRAALPVGPDSFSSSILEASPYRMKLLIVEGNPLIGSANSNRVKAAFRTLEFLVYTGLFMEEAAWYADIILPVCSGFEMETVYMRRDDRGIRWQKEVVPRVGESRPDWEIWIDLAHALAKVDTKNPASYWTDNMALEWKDYPTLWQVFVKHTPAMGGMTQARMESRTEPLRWPCPTTKHAGVSTLYLDHPSWYEAVAALEGKHTPGRRFLTASGKVEVFTAALDKKLGTAGHRALPMFYTHPEVTGHHPTIEYRTELVDNPVNPGALTPNVVLGGLSDGAVHRDYPLMGMVGRASVVHFAGVTQWTYTGKQMNGIRFVQMHPSVAAKAGIANGDDITVESPQGSIRGTALLWPGIREDTVFVPNSFGPRQIMAKELGTPLYEPANVLINDRYFDNLSGQQAYKCFACRVQKA